MTNSSPRDADRGALRSETVLAQAHWTERSDAARDGERARPVALAREAAVSRGDRLRRAIGAPIAAGIAVLVLAVAGAVAIAVLQGGGALRAEAGRGSAAQEGGSASAADDPAGGASGAEGAHVVVHVVGAVATPGVVELEAGARVQDAIAAAGGATEAAVRGALNLAREVSDGEQLLVPDAAGTGAAEGAGAAGGAAAAADGSAGGGVAPDGRVDLNGASESELQELPGIGPALAGRIAEWRRANGRFGSIEQLEGLRERAAV